MDWCQIETGVHNDVRREITDFVLPKELLLPFPIRQVKTVRMHDEAVRNGLIVGNHFHTVESDRHEFFVALGPDGPLFEARYRQDGLVRSFTMLRGSACIIRPLESHAFKPLQTGTVLVGLSNLPFDSTHDVRDPLFF